MGRGCVAVSRRIILTLSGERCRAFLTDRLERFKKNCSHPVELRMKPGLLTFGVVSAQSQGFQTYSFAKSQNSRLRMAALFLEPL
jgi:hypothetical protein